MFTKKKNIYNNYVSILRIHEKKERNLKRSRSYKSKRRRGESEEQKNKEYINFFLNSF